MSSAFEYKPKFVDIRVCRPGEKKLARDAHEQRCDHIGCMRPGQHRAPKSRDRANEFWLFCAEHAADYNKRWNYFSGMSDSELEDFQRQAEVGHRPTWTVRAARGDRLSAKANPGAKGAAADPYGLFGRDGDTRAKPAPAPRRRLTRLQTIAFEVLALEEAADASAIRARYAELVKRWHPDSNGGDRGAEAELQRVVQAYQTLKGGGLV